MQNKNESNLIERNYSYASGIYYNSLKVGDKYFKGAKTIVIWLLGFNLFENGNYHEVVRARRAYEDGEKEKSIKVAKKLLEKGTDIEEIAEVTGLEECEITELKD